MNNKFTQLPLLLLLSLAMLITLSASFVRFAVHGRLNFYGKEELIPEKISEKINEVLRQGI